MQTANAFLEVHWKVQVVLLDYHFWRLKPHIGSFLWDKWKGSICNFEKNYRESKNIDGGEF